MAHWPSKTRHSYNPRSLLVALVIVVGVLAPTAGVLWFMNEAMQNERLAVRQRLEEAYQSQLRLAEECVRSFWKDRLSQISHAAGREDSRAAFAELVKSGAADSLLFFDQHGTLTYPDLDALPAPASAPSGPDWQRARQAEFDDNAPQAAAEVYSRIALKAPDATEAARALQSEARCLYKARKPDAALRALASLFNGVRYQSAQDDQARLIVPNSLLLAITITKELPHPDIGKLAATLCAELNNYQFAMPASQRQFLMRQLKELWADCPAFPTLDAEEIAAAFWEKHEATSGDSRLQLSALPEIWKITAADGKVVALFRQRNLLAALNAATESASVPGIRIEVSPPGKTSNAGLPLLTAALDESSPSWRLALSLNGPDPFAVASSRRTTVYLWTGILVTGGIALLALLLAGYIRRHIRLTRLKNDLIATVSHELKTPLSSMRVLVDTLMEGRCQDSQQVDDYLQLIAKENVRLSKLIDNFLTFSRMERHKIAFEPTKVRMEEIVHSAVEALEDRLKAPGCRLEVVNAPGLPVLTGDRDALVTVVVNLLDNALKYSGDAKHISVRSFAEDGSVCVEVSDDGIGFPRRAAKRIFDRFYQVDRSLARKVGGCGLGLSIVKFIVNAHGGAVSAESQLGKGSTFTVRLPAA